MVAPPSVSVGDLEFAFYKAAVPAADLNLAVTLGQGIKAASPQVASKWATTAGSASSVAPGVGGAVSSIAVTNTGYYEVQVSVGFGATAESTTLDNFTLRNNGAAVSALGVANAVNTMSQVYKFYMNLGAGQNISVTAGLVAGSAGSVYKAFIAATQVA